MKKTLWVDHDSCIGCGLCVTNVPQVFRLAEHDKAEVYDPGGEKEDIIQQEAMDICPVSCIYLQEKYSNETRGHRSQ